MKRTVLVTAGGTGGHIFPALSVSKLLIKNGFHVIWVGTRSGMENKIVSENEIRFLSIKISGLRKNGLFRLLLMPFLLSYALLQSIGIIIRCRPDVIVGFGGYVSFPVLFAGWLLRVPIVLHEQNSVAGLTNKILAKVADRVCVAYNGVLPSLKTVTVGNPVRDQILDVKSIDYRYKNRNGGLNILVVGGSSGAKIFNDILPEVFAKLTNLSKVVHQVGKGKAELVTKNYHRFSFNPTVNIKVVDFIADMAESYSEADLVICRSGALTVSEICACGVAAIFIPYPHAVDDHQKHNVTSLVETGGAKLLLQSDLTVDRLIEMLNIMTREECLAMASKARRFAVLNSTELIYNCILELTL